MRLAPPKSRRKNMWVTEDTLHGQLMITAGREPHLKASGLFSLGSSTPSVSPQLPPQQRQALPRRRNEAKQDALWPRSRFQMC